MQYYNEIKNQLLNNEINRKVKNYAINKSDLDTYYNVGKLLSDAGKHYGEGIIKEYSKRLMKEVNKRYSERVLYRMKSFYLFSYNNLPTMSAKLSISYYDEMLKLKDINAINYYINICINQNLSVRQLREKIKSKEYERLPEETKEKLKRNDKLELKETIPNPIIINNTNNYDEISEKVLQKIIMEDIPAFLESLGNGYTFIKNEYKIKMDNRYNYIDLLLYNYIYHCFVVIELKINELDKRDIGQIEIYMNYINENVKTMEDNKTIGIILCKEDNQLIIKYASDERIIAIKYQKNNQSI